MWRMFQPQIAADGEAGTRFAGAGNGGGDAASFSVYGRKLLDLRHALQDESTAALGGRPRGAAGGAGRWTIDAIATDHAPHALFEKEVEFDKAAFGITGLEIALAAAITELQHTGMISMSRVVELLSTNPAKIVGLSGRGTLAKGSAADVTIFDPKKRWSYEVEQTRSRSRNCPYGGMQFYARCGRRLWRQDCVQRVIGAAAMAAAKSSREARNERAFCRSGGLWGGRSRRRRRNRNSSSVEKLDAGRKIWAALGFLTSLE